MLYDRFSTNVKVAVGTSTFIVTFTALIVSVSHTMIHPAIVPDRSTVLIYRMTVTTAALLWPTRFADRVDNCTNGLVTGVILTAMNEVLAFTKASFPTRFL